MSDIDATPKIVRQLHVECVSNGGVAWADMLKLDEGDSYTETPDGWEFVFAEKNGTRIVTVERVHTFFHVMRLEEVAIAPMYIPTEHRDKAPAPRKVGRRVEVVN